jgi:hypothetical protein
MATPRRRRASRNDWSEDRLLLSEDSEEDSIQPVVGLQDKEGGEEDNTEEDLAVKKDEDDSRPSSVRIATGVLETISQKYESLDYEVNFNSLMLDEIRKRGWKFVLAKVKSFLNINTSTTRT